MSANPNSTTPTGAVQADHGHADGGHGTLKGYLMGFGLSVILTAIPFWLVMGHVIPDSRTLASIIMVFAVAQIFVHMIYFLHMNTRVEGGWSMLAMIFTVVVVVITISGSVWVMYNMNANMMPMAPGGMPNSPNGMPMMPHGMHSMP